MLQFQEIGGLNSAIMVTLKSGDPEFSVAATS